MATTTTNRSYTYPESTDDVRVHEDMQALAEDIDTDVQGIIEFPMGRLVQTVAQTGVASGATQAVTFSTEDLDTHNFHSTSSNTNRVTPTVAGWYRFHGSISLAGATDYTILQAVLRKNSTALAPAYRSTGASAASQTLVFGTTALIDCNGSGDFVDLCFIVSKTAGTISTVISTQFACVLEWEYKQPL
jgi:hypothetical protein